MARRAPLRTRLVVEGGLVIALSVVLSFVTIWQMPQGGSISLAMLPMLVYAFRRGLVPGFIAGALYGVIDALLKPYVVHPIQFLLDYPVAFGALGLAGMFSALWVRNVRAGHLGRGVVVALVPGVLLAALGRYAAHVLSGMVYFAEYAGDSPVLVYSLVYNSFVLVSAAACLVAIPLLMRALPAIEEGDRR
jgi:thiamine transporter